MTELDDRLKAHYRSLEAPAGLIQKIEQRRSSPVMPFLERFQEFFLQHSRAASVAAIVLIAALTVSMHQFGTYSERTQRTLNEAAMNHSTRLQFEFESASIDEIDKSMSQLPFEVALPGSFGDQYRVLGARYCTINGELAAHVKFINNETNKLASLFMTRSANGLQGIETKPRSIDGVNVRLWNESGLFYALASRAPLI